MKTMQTEIPENLYKEVVALAKEGWFRDEKEVFSEAIRRFLESHQPELMDQFIREDVEWGFMVRIKSKIMVVCDAGPMRKQGN
jgi:metal-responsive CopG/Arc/MetJ family transcriptional regulator